MLLVDREVAGTFTCVKCAQVLRSVSSEEALRTDKVSNEACSGDSLGVVHSSRCGCFAAVSCGQLIFIAGH